MPDHCTRHVDTIDGRILFRGELLFRASPPFFEDAIGNLLPPNPTAVKVT